MNTPTDENDSYDDDFTADIVDAHCHLNLPPLSDNISDVIKEAKAAGLKKLVTCSVSSGDDWERTRSIASLHNGFVIPFFGLHPCYLAGHLTESGGGSCWESELEKLLQADANAHVGECGLDLRVKKEVSLEVQEQYLLRHISLASRWGRVLCIHCVQSWGRLYKILKEQYAPCAAEKAMQGVILHSSNGIPEAMIGGFAALPDVFFSLNGRHTTSDKEHATIRSIPMERMLLETDSPDQLPLYFRDLNLTHNHPRLLRYTVVDIARLRKVSPSSLANITTANFNRLFRVL